MIQTGQCEICGALEDTTLYRYYPPALSRLADSRPASVALEHRYSSEHSVAVSLCRRCVHGKRRRTLAAYGLGMLISLPLVSIVVGAFGVLWCGYHIWRLKDIQEAGDIIAINWRSLTMGPVEWPISIMLDITPIALP